MNTPRLSYAGNWDYATAPGAAIVPYVNQITLANGSKGLVLAGWSWAGPGNTTYRPTKVAILDQDDQGLLKVNTDHYIKDSAVNGAGSVIISDFNQDGFDDIFLAAYNESPSQDKSSTAYITDSLGNYQKVNVGDSVQAHSAVLGDLNGQATIVTAGYGGQDSYYQYNLQTQRFDVKTWGNDYNIGTQHIKSYYGSSSVIADFDNDGRTDIVIGDNVSSPGINYDPDAPAYFAVYRLEDNRLASMPAFKTTMYFDNRVEYASYDSEFSGQTHTYRMWTDDFNHDGLTDVLAGTGIWTLTDNFQASQLEMMQNTGGLQFVDRTDQLNQVYDTDSTNVDYSMQLLDIDHSGIDSYLLGDLINPTVEDNSNYLLLNDGTGKLYTALHDEFITWGQQTKDYLTSIGIDTNDYSITPKFIAYQNDDGNINYLAEWMQENDTVPLVNVAVNYNSRTDFVQDVAITDRNHSQLIRTWAGDDSVTDSGANTSAHIDLGLGFDQVNYSDALRDYQISRVNGEFVVKHLEAGRVDQTDTLTNVERLHFADADVALDVNGTAGQAYRLYKAAFDRAPDQAGLGYWIDALDDGASLTGVAAGFVNSPEFQWRYGSNVSDQAFVYQLYQNVLDRAPEAAGFNYWVDAMHNGMSREAVLTSFSESPENQHNVEPLVAVGIQYHEWIG